MNGLRVISELVMGPNLSIKMRISIGNNRFANVECLVHADSAGSVGDLYVAVDFTMDAMFHVGRIEIDKEANGFVSQT